MRGFSSSPVRSRCPGAPVASCTGRIPRPPRPRWMVRHLLLFCSAVIHLGRSGRYMDQAIGDWHGARLSDQEPEPCTQANVSASILRANCKSGLAVPFYPVLRQPLMYRTPRNSAVRGGPSPWCTSQPHRQSRCRRPPNDGCPLVCHTMGDPAGMGFPHLCLG